MSLAYVRAQAEPELPAPLLTSGAFAWARENLFSSPANAAVTLAAGRPGAVAGPAARRLGDGQCGVERARRRALPLSIRTAPAGRSSRAKSTICSTAPIPRRSAGASI